LGVTAVIPFGLQLPSSIVQKNSSADIDLVDSRQGGAPPKAQDICSRIIEIVLFRDEINY
jgi:hypothetical protein